MERGENMAVFFDSGLCNEQAKTVGNETIDKAIVSAANVIMNVIKEEYPDMCTTDVCKYVAKKLVEYFLTLPIA